MRENKGLGAIPESSSAALHGADCEVGMVERVARAMAVADGCNPDDPAYVRYPSGNAFGVCWRDKYATKARAAIAAMREPTDRMAGAGSTASYQLDSFIPGWEAAIDAALTEEPR